MSIGKLILYPYDTELPPPKVEALSTSLRKLGLIGQPIDKRMNSFLAGEHFLQLISFVGCSPDVCLAPRESRATGFCHLSICGPFEPPQLIFANDCCPACKQPLSNWKKLNDNRYIKCIHCGESHGAQDITWGRRAGYGRMFIEIHNIFPGEARPVDALFKQLQQESGLNWNYFFTTANE